MPPSQKGKAPTKGAKQILTENTATLYFYRNMALGAGLFYNFTTIAFFFESISYTTIFLNLLVTVLYMGSYQMMCYMSRPRYSDNSLLVDAGLDLNMDGGVGEHVKDVVILSSVTHVLAVISNYFWLLLLLLPMRAMWLLWTHVLSPWFFQGDPQDIDQDEKKRKKMERRMKRFQ